MVPQETLLAKCIRVQNYAFLRLLLEEYPERFKDIINKLIRGIGNDDEMKNETDLHYFVLNQIESAKKWRDDNEWHDEKERDEYGKQIAETLSTFLPLFKKAGARFDIPDALGKTVADYLNEWKDKFHEGSIPEDVEAGIASDVEQQQ